MSCVPKTRSPPFNQAKPQKLHPPMPISLVTRIQQFSAAQAWGGPRTCKHEIITPEQIHTNAQVRVDRLGPYGVVELRVLGHVSLMMAEWFRICCCICEFIHRYRAKAQGQSAVQVPSPAFREVRQSYRVWWSETPWRHRKALNGPMVDQIYDPSGSSRAAL
jgi:hypothetical protein